MNIQHAIPTPRTKIRNFLRFLWVPPILMILMAGASKIFGFGPARENMTASGGEHMIIDVGLIQLASVVIFLIPRTRRLGFFLFVAIIGGIMAVQWVMQQFNLGTILMMLLWAGMYFEDESLFGLSSSKSSA